ncbi:MAG: beta-lactamase family protein [Rhodocyclaceae bacterium]|nr:beta-lactamase family protein [Rhodocyclaceae bacterium]
MTERTLRSLFSHSAWLVSGLLFSTPAAALDLETPARKFLRTSGAPAVAVAVLEKGQREPQSLSLGLACVDNPVPLRDAGVMKLGSVTKVFTGIRIRMLIEAGQLAPETTVGRFFPDFPRGDEITVRHLLTHTSGLPEMLRQPAIVSRPTKSWQPGEMLDILKTLPLDFDPGTRQQYSNSGYLLLGMIVEAVTGEPYAGEIRRQVAEPLGMGSVLAGDDLTLVANEACGHASDDRGRLQKPVMTSQRLAFATGDLIGTATDTVRLVNLGKLLHAGLPEVAQLRPHRLADGTPAVRVETFPQLDLELESSQLEGLVWYRLKRTGMRLVGKDGMYPGFASWFLYDPETTTAVAALTNLETRAMELMLLAVDILEQRRREVGGAGRRR